MPPWEKHQAAPQASAPTGPWSRYTAVGQARTQPAPTKNSGVDSAVAGASQGYTLGFGDEIMGGFAGGGRYLMSRVIDAPGSSEKSFQEIYREERDKTRGEIDQAAKDHPALYGTGLVGGAVASPVKFKGGVVSQGVKGGAAFGAGESEADSLGGVALDAAKGGATGAIGGAALKGAGKLANASIKGTQNIIKGASSRSIEALDDVAARMKTASSADYAAMRSAGATINPQATQKVIADIETAVKNDGILNPSLHANVLSVLGQMKAAAKGKGLDLEELDQWRQLLGQVAGNFNDKINARKARIAISAIDDAVNTLGATSLSSGTTQAVQALQKAREGWARMSRFEAVSNIVRRSDGDANFLKRELKKFLDNPKKTRGFSPEEMKALTDASRLSGGEGVMKMLGKFGIDLGNSRIGSGVGAGVGALGGGLAQGASGALMVPAVGTAARYGQKAITRGKAERLLDAIETGAYSAPKGVNVSPGVQGAVGRAVGTTVHSARDERPEAGRNASAASRNTFRGGRSQLFTPRQHCAGRVVGEPERSRPRGHRLRVIRFQRRHVGTVRCQVGQGDGNHAEGQGERRRPTGHGRETRSGQRPHPRQEARPPYYGRRGLRSTLPRRVRRRKAH